MLQPTIVKRFNSNRAKGVVKHGDALLFLESIKTNSVDLVILDPPFNLNKKYTNNGDMIDNKNETEYYNWMISILNESSRILRNGGSLYLYHLPKWAIRFAAHLDCLLTFRHWIALSMNSGFARKGYLYPAHYALLYFTKGEPLNFVRPKIQPKRCRTCNQYIKDYGGYRKIIESNGINLSDYWSDTNPIHHKKLKWRSANELPHLIYERIYSISSVTNGKIVDPFVGTGKSAVYAVKFNMSFMCCDIVIDNCLLSINKLLEYISTEK